MHLRTVLINLPGPKITYPTRLSLVSGTSKGEFHDAGGGVSLPLYGQCKESLTRMPFISFLASRNR